MAITAQLVKELRDRTGAGMMDCKHALQETNGDIEAAVDYLREKGIAKAAKKQSRIAAEGLANVLIQGNEALLFELNSETDFVSKNDKFLNLLELVGTSILNSKAVTTEEALQVIVDGKSIETVLADATATIGEKITLRNVQRVVKKDKEGFGSYKHLGGRIVVLVTLDGENDVVAKDVAMHVAALNPRFLDKSQVDQATLDHEKHILTEQALQEGKPANIVEKMIEGRLNKFLQEICLVDQVFVKDPDLKVGQYVKNHKVNILNYIRLEVGAGIEKREENFAEEVLAQVKK